jgi:hypothetical protein
MILGRRMRWFGVHKGEIWVLQCGWELITKIKVKGTLAAAGALLGRGGLATWFTRLLGISDMSWKICWAACRQSIIMIAGSFWTSPPAHTNKMLLSLSLYFLLAMGEATELTPKGGCGEGDPVCELGKMFM